MKKRKRALWMMIAIIGLLLQSTACCVASAAAQEAIRTRRPQGKSDFSLLYQNTFDFLREYAASGSFVSLDDWSDVHIIALARHLINMFPEKYPESKPNETITEDTARKYVYQFFTPIADTRLAGVCVHLWGNVSGWDYEANALFSLLANPVITEDKHIIPLLPKAGDLQAMDAQTAAEKVMKERFGFTSEDLNGMDKFSYFAVIDTYHEAEPCWCFQYRQANGAYCNVDLSNEGKLLAFGISNYAQPLPEIAKKCMEQARSLQNAAIDPIGTAKNAMVETCWISLKDAPFLGDVLYSLPLYEGAPMQNGWVVDLFLHGELVGRAAIRSDGTLAEIIRPWERFTVQFVPPFG